ncbi:Zn-dependent protease [Candidatus Scalindua japonica]|uniref:Zn-dependent protease n=1 Tax=Candidatus Scalindua japonica TaxID=1284222 RepID=A0A286TWJ0_9BACT|nr:M48 family metallopeptidase [Candidatus Scalindua japonica]GAX60201.1 Zn-dependent protease [Candidatus Scalindua japonica]
MMYKYKLKTIQVQTMLSMVLSVSILINGCVNTNTGPPLSQNELKKLEENIELLATEIYLNDLVRVWKVGLKVLNILPEGVVKKRAVTGMLIVDNTEDIARYYRLSTEEGCVVVSVVDNYIADHAGIRDGDIIKEIDGKEIRKSRDIAFENGESSTVVVERDNTRLSLDVKPEEKPYVRICLNETGRINAYAKFSGIEFTSGMVHFVEDDNELAVIMGHELAHLTARHLPRNIRMAALYGTLGCLTGPFAPLTTKALYAPYSRENEREADYLGLIYAHNAGYDIEKGVDLWKRFALEIPKSRSKSFLRGHPASPERILRVKRVVELIKAGNNPLEDFILN